MSDSYPLSLYSRSRLEPTFSVAGCPARLAQAPISWLFWAVLAETTLVLLTAVGPWTTSHGAPQVLQYACIWGFIAIIGVGIASELPRPRKGEKNVF